VSLSLTDEHIALTSSVRDLVTDRKLLDSARATLDSASTDLPASWSEVARNGLLGMHVPEDHGGQGAGLQELAIVVEELGRPGAVVAGPRRRLHAGRSRARRLALADRWLRQR
jgi:alkylation response protein AidB-like acyl-CoA dehydrogenase